MRPTTNDPRGSTQARPPAHLPPPAGAIVAATATVARGACRVPSRPRDRCRNGNRRPWRVSRAVPPARSLPQRQPSPVARVGCLLARAIVAATATVARWRVSAFALARSLPQRQPSPGRWLPALRCPWSGFSALWRRRCGRGLRGSGSGGRWCGCVGVGGSSPCSSRVRRGSPASRTVRAPPSAPSPRPAGASG